MQVAYLGRYGQIRRAWVVPANPNTLAQQLVRQNLTTQAKAYDALTEAEQNAWIATAAQLQCKSSLGQSGPMTGLQLFTKVNCSLLAIGGDPVTAPPALPTFEPLPISALQITNTGGAIALKLTTTGSPPDGTMLWVARPQRSGTRRATSFKFVGTLGSPVSGAITITTDYTNTYGVPAVGDRIFVAANANLNGFEGPRLVFTAVVPASS